MEGKPIPPEVLALTEKKMSMTLDDIINMSKTNDNKGRRQRVWNRNLKFSNNGSQVKNANVERVKNNQSFMRRKFSNNGSQDRNGEVQRFMNNRSFMRQGALAQRRTIFRGNQFPLATEAAKKAAAAPIHSRAFNQRRALNVNKLRVTLTPPRSQKVAANGGGFMMKRNFHHHPKPALMRQNPQMLDARFASMKEQRLKSLSQQNIGPRRNGGFRQSNIPWARDCSIR